MPAALNWLFWPRRSAPRKELVRKLQRDLGRIDPRYEAALLEVSREDFVRPEDRQRANEDVPLPLDDEGTSTISAPHAYVLSFDLVGLGPGDRVLELGSGTGYGAALAAHVVGLAGHVTTVEIDPTLAAKTRENVAEISNVTAITGDAMSVAWDSPNKVLCTFSVERIASEWIDRLAEGAVLVAPVGPPQGTQRLVRLERKNGQIVETSHTAVRYVANRSVLASVRMRSS
jgi:protein-L-isoaspartate(D-aspartate) O-methyltransferase